MRFLALAALLLTACASAPTLDTDAAACRIVQLEVRALSVRWPYDQPIIREANALRIEHGLHGPLANRRCELAMENAR